MVRADKAQIENAVMNLVVNARDAVRSKGGGTVRLRTARLSQAEAILAKIFDPFFTTKEVGQGTGLGLSIAYKIVQEHGGRIEVKSTVGRGTTFSVFLPVKAVQPQALAA